MKVLWLFGWCLMDRRQVNEWLLGAMLMLSFCGVHAALVEGPAPRVDSEVTSGHADMIEPLLAPNNDEHDRVSQRQDFERAGVQLQSVGDRVASHIVNLPVFRTLFFEESKARLYGGEHLIDEKEQGRVYVTDEGKPFTLDMAALGWVAAALIVLPLLIGIFISRLRAAKLRTLRMQQPGGRHHHHSRSASRRSRGGRRGSRRQPAG